MATPAAAKKPLHRSRIPCGQFAAATPLADRQKARARRLARPGKRHYTFARRRRDKPSRR